MELALLALAFVITVLLVSSVAERLKLSAPLTLLVVGGLVGYLPFVHVPELTPEFVLVGLLPPLLYSAAVNTSVVDFRANISSIGWLSVGLVLFTAAGVALVLTQILPVGFAVAFAIGAIVAPPDAVAATAVARQIGLPRRIVTILEGESLVNDATALVSLRTAVNAMVATVSVGAVLFDFAKSVAIALIIGFVVAKVAIWLYRSLKNVAATVALSFLVPFAAYVPAEELHASGVLAVVVAGLVLGNKAPVVQSAQTRISQQLNWHTIAFVLENSVFLLIGLQVHQIVLDVSESDLPGWTIVLACLATLLAVMVLRVLWVFATRLFLRSRNAERPALGNAVLLAWAGMRGVVTLAAALTLPTETPHRSVLVLIALVVTAGTLLIQGLTLPWIARRMRVTGPDPREDALQEATVYQRAVTAGLAEVDRIAQPGEQDVVARLRESASMRANASWERLGRQDTDTPNDVYRRLRVAALGAERAEVLRVRDAGQADHEVLSGVLNALDVEESLLTRVEAKAQRLDEIAAPAVTAAPCQHMADLPACVQPLHPEGCGACELAGTPWVHLRMCLTCGHVGCCDSSPGKHATAHFHQSGHPVMRSFEPGESWRWCYVDEVLG